MAVAGRQPGGYLGDGTALRFFLFEGRRRRISARVGSDTHCCGDRFAAEGLAPAVSTPLRSNALREGLPDASVTLIFFMAVSSVAADEPRLDAANDEVAEVADARGHAPGCRCQMYRCKLSPSTTSLEVA